MAPRLARLALRGAPRATRLASPGLVLPLPVMQLPGLLLWLLQLPLLVWRSVLLQAPMVLLLLQQLLLLVLLLLLPQVLVVLARLARP